VTGEAAWIDGVVEGALAFDGIDDAITFPATFPFHQPGNATLLLWVRWTDGTHRAIVWSRDGNGAPDANRFHLFSGWLGYLSCDGGEGLGFDYRQEDGTLHRLLCAPGLAAGPWYHVAITRRTVPPDTSATSQVDVYALFVNGAKVSEAVDSTPVLPTYAGPWTVGTRDGFMFSGAVDEIALYPRALTPEEIAERYQRSLNGLPYETPAPLTCTSWDVAREFRLPPGQANPSADLCGNSVWSYLYAPGPTPDPAAYAPLAVFARDWNAYQGLAGWFMPYTPGAYCGDTCLPMVGYNGSGGSAFVVPWAPYEWLARTVVVHPGYTQPAIVAFRAPLAGKVLVEEARFDIVDPHCSDGVDWTVQHGASVLGSGVAYIGAAASFTGEVDVAAGDMVYARLGPNGNLYCDSTQVAFRLRQLSVAVGVDVMPGSAENPITRASRGTVPAAILGAAGFDAASVDPATLELAGAPIALVDGGLPRAALQDVNGDGRLDLVAHFPVPRMTLTTGPMQLSLSGALRDGTKLTGGDTVRVR
jgi:hypothetical protein